jgi:hypothetical protein
LHSEPYHFYDFIIPFSTIYFPGENFSAFFEKCRWPFVWPTKQLQDWTLQYYCIRVEHFDSVSPLRQKIEFVWSKPHRCKRFWGVRVKAAMISVMATALSSPNSNAMSVMFYLGRWWASVTKMFSSVVLSFPSIESQLLKVSFRTRRALFL